MDEDYRPSGGGFTAPVKVGDELDVTIEAVGEKGDGLAKRDGFVLFIPNTQEGDNVRVKVTRVLRKVGFAEVVGEGSPSEDQGAEQDAPPAEDVPEEAEDSEDFGEETDAEEQSEDDSEDRQ